MTRELGPVGRYCGLLIIVAVALSLYGCNDVSSVTAPPPGPGPLTILTSSPLPDGTVNANYSVALSATGGTPGYSWSLAPGSPQPPAGLTLSPNGVLSGKPTTPGGPVDLLINVNDSATTPASVQKTLSITINVAPTPLQITSTSPLPSGTINVAYFAALTGNGGTTPYTWGLKAGSPPLPPGLTLDTANGFIQGTPTQTSNTTPIFTLRDAALTTVEKALALTIGANPLSITTDFLPQGTANQNYSAQLAASGGTGSHTWGLAGGSPPLPNGLTLSATGLISGIPTTTSSQTHTFSVTDQTPPTPQTATKPLQLTIGAAPPTLTITTTSPLPSGTVTVAYNFTLAASGGTGTKTWDITSGSLPAGLNLSSSGVISGTPLTTGTTTPTFRVRDSGSPQQTATKQLSITINNPAAPNITTTALPNGSFNNFYNQTLQVSGGIPPLIWGVITGALPPGLGINASNGQISGTATQTGTFGFTVQVTDVIPQSDTQVLTITITAPTPPQITTSSLPNGTVTQSYPVTTLQASGGTAPLIWDSVVSPSLPNGLTWDASTHTITGIPLNGSQGTTSHTFTVRDSTNPPQTATRTLSLTINLPAPPNITTTSLSNGTVASPYSQTVQATGGTGALTWSISAGSLPTGLNPINPSTGQISGTPSAAGTFNFTVRATDTLNQFDTQALSITVVLPAPPNITTSSLPNGTISTPYSQTVMATGGTGALTWSIQSGSLPPPLGISPTTGVISGTPNTAGPFNFTVRATDTLNQFDDQPLSITINLPAPPNITTSSLPNGKVGQAYSQQVQATGGVGALTWGISAGALPPGLNIDPATGVISGNNPTTSGLFNFTVQVTDTIPQSDTQALSIMITP